MDTMAPGEGFESPVRDWAFVAGASPDDRAVVALPHGRRER
jgi:hypothetical protein